MDGPEAKWAVMDESGLSFGLNWMIVSQSGRSGKKGTVQNFNVKEDRPISFKGPSSFDPFDRPV